MAEDSWRFRELSASSHRWLADPGRRALRKGQDWPLPGQHNSLGRGLMQKMALAAPAECSVNGALDTKKGYWLLRLSVDCR